MTAKNIPTRLDRLERDHCTGCDDLPPLPDYRTVLEQAEPTRAEARTLLVARTERLLAAVWPRAMRGDTRAAETALRLMERQAAALGLVGASDPARDRTVSLEELMNMIESDPEDDPDA